MREALARHEPTVIALGGGAVDDARRSCATTRAVVVQLQIDAETAWERVRRSERPLAQDEARVPPPLRGAARRCTRKSPT